MFNLHIVYTLYNQKNVKPNTNERKYIDLMNITSYSKVYRVVLVVVMKYD